MKKLQLLARVLIILALMSFMSGCNSMKQDIKDMQNRLDTLEGTKITSINEQIKAINASITDLKSTDNSLDAYIKTLLTTSAELQKQINNADSEIEKLKSESGNDDPDALQELIDQLNSMKKTFESELAVVNNTLSELKSADSVFDARITELEEYIDQGLIPSKDWVESSFVTLAKYEQTQAAISEINALIEQINKDMTSLEMRINGKISSEIKAAVDELAKKQSDEFTSRIEATVKEITSAYTAAVSSAKNEMIAAFTAELESSISASEAGMKIWVNELLAQNYYDMVAVDAKLDILSARIDENDADLQKQMNDQKSLIESMKAEFSEVCKDAIAEAIEANNAVIDASIAKKVQEVEDYIAEEIESIIQVINSLQDDLKQLQDNFRNRIQSLRFIPEYSDRIVPVDAGNKTLSIDFLVTPSYLAEDLVSAWEANRDVITAYFRYTKEPETRAGNDAVILPVSSVTADAEGNLTVHLSESAANPFTKDFLLGLCPAIVYLKISDGNNEVVSDIVDVRGNGEIYMTIGGPWEIVDTGKISAEGSEMGWPIETNSSDVIIDIPEEDKSWVTCVYIPEYTSVHLIVSENTGLERSTVIKLRAVEKESVFVQIVVTQSGMKLLPDFASAKILSSGATANSYIVSEAGHYMFSTTKGNSNEQISQISKAIVLWESYGTQEIIKSCDLIAGVKYSDGKIAFVTNEVFKEGNAVIAAKNASGDILWSWHIWLTDKPAEQVYYNGAGIMMDRNLGATSATPGDVGALGLFYQWGRKDPFIGTGDKRPESPYIESAYAAEYSIFSYDISNPSKGTVGWSISNPMVFIQGNTRNYDWYYSGNTTTDKTRWASEKTMYDPCPPGWRIPDGGTDGIWGTALGDGFVASDVYDTLDEANYGRNLAGKFGDDDTIWYPASGYFNGDKYVDSGYLGYYWSVTPSGGEYDSRSYLLYLSGYEKYGFDHEFYNRNDYGMSVRCMKE